MGTLLTRTCIPVCVPVPVSAAFLYQAFINARDNGIEEELARFSL